MNQTEKTVLLANALISEIIPLVQQDMSDKAFEAIFKARINDAIDKAQEMLKERLHTAIMGKNIFQVFLITWKMNYFSKKQMTQLRQLAEPAFNVAEDLVERKTFSELARMGLGSINLSKTMKIIIDDAALEAGL